MIPVANPLFAKNSQKYVTSCISSGWVSGQGPYIEKLEGRFSKHLGASFSITTTNRTSALHLALVALGIGKGDEVIVPTLTMIAPIFAILYTGARPVLIDSDPVTFNIDVSKIKNKITDKTRALLAVHLYGHPVDVDPLLSIAKKYHLYVIEDAAEALGSEYKGVKVGTLGDIACFSLYANKLITTGEGGMVVTNSKNLAEKVKSLKDMAHHPKKRFSHTDIGFNYRMSNLQAALGLAQLEKIDTLLAKKRWVAAEYFDHLHNITYLTLPPQLPWAKNSYWMYGVLVKNSFGLSKDQLRRKLFKKGIDTRDFFIPMHKQPVFQKLGLFKNEYYPVADDVSKRGLYLPSGPNISKKEIKTVCDTIKSLYANM